MLQFRLAMIKVDSCLYNEVFFCHRIVETFFNTLDEILETVIAHNPRNLSVWQIEIELDSMRICRGLNKMLGKQYFTISQMKEIGDA